MQFMGNSDRLQSLIEKIHAKKESNPSTSAEEGETSASEETTSERADSETGSSIGLTESAPYPCQFCHKAFSRYSYLKKHEQSHSGLLLFRCDFCSRLFKHKRSRDRHIKLHTGDKKYKCTQCEAAFSRSDHLKIHMKTHDNQKPYQCAYCNRGYNTAAALTSHLQNHKKEIALLSPNSEKTVNSTFRCLRCNIIFTKYDELNVHMANRHSGVAEYANNGVTVGSNSNSEYTCTCSCNERFVSIEDLQTHIQEKHDGNIRDLGRNLKTFLFGTPELSCEECHSTFSSASAMHLHFKYNHGFNYGLTETTDQTKPTDLSVVKKNENTTPSNLKNPRMTKSTNSSAINNKVDAQYNPGTLLCNQCDAALPDFESFRNHLKSHLEENRLASIGDAKQRWLFCPYCRRSGSSMQELIKHISSHILTTVTEYPCQICHHSYPTSTELERHLLDVHSHHLYLCYACKAVFENKYEIQKHFLKKHFSEMKTFKCLVCPTFEPTHSEVEFDLHVGAVHCAFDSSLAPNVSLQCAYCNENCKSRPELENHMKMHCHSPIGFRKHKCNICDAICHSAVALAEHKLTHCKVTYRSTCSHCKAVITTEEDFLNHMMRHNNCLSAKTNQLTLPVPCVICRQTLVSESETRLHAKFHLQIVSVQCPACLQNSERNDHKEGVCSKCFENQKAHRRCTHCQIVLDCKEDYDKHTEGTCSASNFCEYKCNLCILSFSGPNELQAHLIEHTFLGCANFTCYVCHAVFTASTGLQQHITEHNGIMKPFICMKCKMQFFFRAELQHHMYTHQPKVRTQDLEDADRQKSISSMKIDVEEDSINNNL